MGRPVILGNGALTVGLNEHGLVHDFYYPYVGLENLTTARSAHHKIGVWVDNRFSWVDDDTWQIEVNFESEAPISDITMLSNELGVKLKFKDFVDSEYNVFCRNIEITNISENHQNVRLFMHQVFQISRAGRADTALFVPDDNYILDYKGRVSLLIYGETDGKTFDQFAIGNYGIEGKEGTFKDAEDGILSGSAVEHGGVDSVMRFELSLSSNESKVVDYWIVAADSQQDAFKIHSQVLEHTASTRQQKTRLNSQAWLSLSEQKRQNIPEEYKDMITKSLVTIRTHIDRRGGVIASCDSSIYNYGRDYYSYVWPRDGAYVVWPLIRLGYKDEPKKFFEFCRDILNPNGYLMHKYQPDRAIGSTWHPLLHGKHKELAIQEDETAIVIYMLGEYLQYSQDEEFVQGLYTTLVQPSANFMSNFIDESTNLPHASYDLWEEKFITSTYTVAVVYQALLTAADFAEKFEYPDDALKWRTIASKMSESSSVLFNPELKHFRKGFLLDGDGSLGFDNTLDVSSVYGVVMFGLHSGTEEIFNSLTAIKDVLLDKSPSGGCPRYENDHYFASDPPNKGNPWFVTTLWMAQFFIKAGQFDKAKQYIDWVHEHSLSSGILSEQVNPNDGTIVSVTPLIWSHAEYINTILDISKSNLRET